MEFLTYFIALRFIYNPVVWLIIGVLILIVEFEFPGFVIFWFGVGAWFVALILWLGIIESLNAILFTWIISSVILLISLRKWMKSIFGGFVSETSKGANLENEYIGKIAEVIEDIGPDFKAGKIKFQGSYWKAQSKELKKGGEQCEIIGKENITFTVK